MRENQEVFIEIEKHLCEDDRPSLFLEKASQEGWFDSYPLSLLKRLKEVDQSPKHHPEGNVWNHTMLVVDEGARVKHKSGNPKVFMWAAFLHDIGKGLTTKKRNGKITSYDHDKIGANLTKSFFMHFSQEEDFIKSVASLVRWHMQILFVLKKLPFANIKKMMEEVDLHEIALLGFCDRMGRLGSDRNQEEANIKDFIAKCRRA